MTIFYKYTSYAGAQAIIKNCSIKLSVPSVFNDPFDILIEEALGSEVEEFLSELMPTFFDWVCEPLDHSILRPGRMRDEIVLINSHIRSMSADTLAEFRKEYLNKPPEQVCDLASMRSDNALVVSTIRNMLKTYGVFCSSINKDSLLMWSHYADHHRGAVLQLEPDIHRDSALLASRSVTYSDERPLLYRTPRDLVEKTFLLSPEEAAKKINEALIYTKSMEWSYEKEYRLAIPRFVPDGASENYLSLYPGEITRIWLGCRMTDDQRATLKALGRHLNPEMQFNRGIMAKRHYHLEWSDDPV